MENTYDRPYNLGDEVEREARADYRRYDFGFADEVPTAAELAEDDDLGYDDDDGLTDVEADAMTLGENIGYDDQPF